MRNHQKIFSTRHPLFIGILMGLSLFAGFESVVLLGKSFPKNDPQPVPVAPPNGMRNWKYIVIHHSGSSVGNENIIQTGHLLRGMENGMAYHFLIGNGSAGLKDGSVVEGHRWEYQLQGGHSHQDYLNETGIGICLVGNFSKSKPTTAQMKSLDELVLKLQTQFQIPDDCIHGHGDFYGEDSDCPGKLFPWTNFWGGVDATYQNKLENDLKKEVSSDR